MAIAGTFLSWVRDFAYGSLNVVQLFSERLFRIKDPTHGQSALQQLTYKSGFWIEPFLAKRRALGTTLTTAIWPEVPLVLKIVISIISNMYHFKICNPNLLRNGYPYFLFTRTPI